MEENVPWPKPNALVSAWFGFSSVDSDLRLMGMSSVVLCGIT